MKKNVCTCVYEGSRTTGYSEFEKISLRKRIKDAHMEKAKEEEEIADKPVAGKRRNRCNKALRWSIKIEMDEKQAHEDFTAAAK